MRVVVEDVCPSRTPLPSADRESVSRRVPEDPSAAGGVGNGSESESLSAKSDSSLLALVAQEDKAAFAELYSRYASSAYRVARRLTRQDVLAEDVVQEAFLEIWRNARRYDSLRGTARTWILAIAHHRGVDELRRHRATRQLPDSEIFLPPQLVVPDVWPEVARLMSAHELRAALLALSAPMREAIALAFFGDLTHLQIAESTGMPLGTIKSRIRLGLLALRGMLM